MFNQVARSLLREESDNGCSHLLGFLLETLQQFHKSGSLLWFFPGHLCGPFELQPERDIYTYIYELSSPRDSSRMFCMYRCVEKDGLCYIFVFKNFLLGFLLNIWRFDVIGMDTELGSLHGKRIKTLPDKTCDIVCYISGPNMRNKTQSYIGGKGQNCGPHLLKPLTFDCTIYRGPL